MENKTFLCIIKDGVYRHPIYFCQGPGLEPQLLEYCPITELSESLSHYSNIYNTYNVLLDGHPSYMTGIKEIINHENIQKYGINKLNITVLRKDI